MARDLDFTTCKSETMEQQLQPQLPKSSLWVNQGEDEDEEAGVGLLTTHPTNRVRAAITICGELAPSPASALTSGTTSDHSIQEDEDEDEAIAGDIRQNEEPVDENEKGDALKREGDGNGSILHFDKFQGSKSINRFYEIPKILSTETNHQQLKIVDGRGFFGLSSALVGHLNEETNKSVNHSDSVIEVDTNADLVGEVEEDLMELDVKTVLDKQSTHDLYCPNCNSCITRKVILVSRKPKFSNIRHKPKHLKKTNSTDDGRSGCTPEIHANVSPILAPGEQNNGRKQEQEAFSCFSCFSLFIPIGNGCFKIFQFFTQGRQNELTQGPQDISQREHTQSPQERNHISQREHTQSPQERNQGDNAQKPPPKVRDNETAQNPEKGSQEENMHSPRHINHDEDAQDPQQGICKNENTETPRKVSDNEDTESPQKVSHEENKHNSQHLNHNEDAQGPQHISCNEDATIPENISYNSSKQRHQDINRNENKQSPRKISTARTNWIFSFSAFHKGKETIEKVQSAAAPTQSVTVGKHVDGVSSTNSSLCDNVKAESREQKFDADMLQRNAGYNEIEDLEAGLVEQTLYRSTEVAPSSQSGTQNESIGTDAGEAIEWEILKSIVYGGLIESITSLVVMCSAAGAGVDTLKALALGLANVIGGLIILGHNIRELKNDRPNGAFTEIGIEEDRYRAVLGRRENFVLHVIVAIASFLVFGTVPAVVYGFSFRKSDDKVLKLAVTAGASLVCIILLALGKARVRKPQRRYFRTVLYYVCLGILASGISYLVGELMKKLAEQVGLFESISADRVPFLDQNTIGGGTAAY
ncbi:hypothetical protein V6N11_058969 [Hibiscus sabdariffa]|uniref:Membrane protein of ER body-like protein n=1 Tax=Hibiscus sabdariffa TaxID=183260 RepID=A0ABR2U6H5_9ROSI